MFHNIEEYMVDHYHKRFELSKLLQMKWRVCVSGDVVQLIKYFISIIRYFIGLDFQNQLEYIVVLLCLINFFSTTKQGTHSGKLLCRTFFFTTISTKKIK